MGLGWSQRRRLLSVSGIRALYQKVQETSVACHCCCSPVATYLGQVFSARFLDSIFSFPYSTGNAGIEDELCPGRESAHPLCPPRPGLHLRLGLNAGEDTGSLSSASLWEGQPWLLLVGSGFQSRLVRRFLELPSFRCSPRGALVAPVWILIGKTGQSQIQSALASWRKLAFSQDEEGFLRGREESLREDAGDN